MRVAMAAFGILLFVAGQAIAFKGQTTATIDVRAEMEAARKSASQAYKADDRPNRVEPDDTAAAQTWQPADERAAQMQLPHSDDSFWGILAGAKIKYQDKAPYISAKITDAIRGYDQKTVTVSGFMLPLDTYESSKHFLLSKYTPTCAFCPPGEPNELIEVFTDKPVKVGYEMTTITGTFHLTNNTDQGIFFTLKNAKALNGPAAGMKIEEPLL